MDNIRLFLEDLYEMDPNLKDREQELIKIISELLASRPDTKFDQGFAEQLRIRLLEMANQTQGNKVMETQKGRIGFFQKWNWLLGGAIAIAVIAVGVWYVDQGAGKKQQLSSLDQVNSLLTFNVSRLGDHAFGELKAQTASLQADRGGSGGESQSDSKSVPISGPAYGMGGGGGGGVGMPAIAPQPDYVQYKYVYRGEKIEPLADKVEVYRKLKGEAAGVQLANVLKEAGLGLVDLGSFSSPWVESISFVEKNDPGYGIYINLTEGQVSISERYMKVMMMEQASTSIRPDQMPSDDQIINVANNFLTSHAIRTDQYGTPEVQKDWMVWYAQTEAKDSFRLSDIQVVYPQMINGKPVYDESGNKTGLSVSVRLGAMRVSSVWNLSFQNYQTSMYDAETDTDKLVRVAEGGGYLYNQSYPMPKPSRVVDVGLGTPTIEYVKVWNWHDGASDELLLPALVFPVLDKPEQGYYLPKNITVPLVKEILKDRIQEGQPLPVPLPAVKEAR